MSSSVYTPTMYALTINATAVTVASSGSIQASSVSANVSNLLIDIGGAITTSGMGYNSTSSAGFGSGMYSISGSSGGSHGGGGGVGRSVGRGLVAAYDDTISPSLAGAAGGGDNSGIYFNK